jgi:hypothetical protein
MYWLTVGTEKVMSLDLEVGRVTPVKSLPAPAGSNCHLTVVRGWLGIAISDGSSPLEKIEVMQRIHITQNVTHLIFCNSI